MGASARLAGQLESLRGRTDGRGANDAAFEGRAGAVAVIDPRDGAVTALASYPTYDPTEFVNGIGTEAYRRLSGNGDPEGNALLNRAIAGQYAPGSTFKLISAYAAMARGVITPRTTFDDRGSYVVGNSRRRNAEGASNGRVDVSTALVKGGWAWHFVRYSNDATLTVAEQEARRDRVGLWQGASPVAPWDARRPTPNPSRASATILYHGNQTTAVFHAPGCRDYDCQHCVMVFSTQKAARSAGFRPHAECVR